MKQNYINVKDKSIAEVKSYLLDLCPTYQKIHDIVNRSIDNDMLKRKLNRNNQVQLYIFMTIKEAIGQCDNLDDLEQHLIFMNLLLSDSFKPVITYKHKLFYYLVKHMSLDETSYLVLRHLITWDRYSLLRFIELVYQSQANYYQIAAKILLIEDEYRLAYRFLPQVVMDASFDQFKAGLYNYDPVKYEKLYNRPSNVFKPNLAFS